MYQCSLKHKAPFLINQFLIRSERIKSQQLQVIQEKERNTQELPVQLHFSY